MAESDRGADAPASSLEEAQERDPRRGVWARRAGLAVMLALVVAAILNAVGQRPADSSAQGTAGSLSVSAPERVRGGLLFQAIFDIHATQRLRRPTAEARRCLLES